MTTFITNICSGLPSVAVIQHHGKSNLERVCLGLWFQRSRVHNGMEGIAFMQEQEAGWPHCVIHTQETEKENRK